MTDLKRRPSAQYRAELDEIWELKNMIKALSFPSWLNTKEENARLQLARQELKERLKTHGKVRETSYKHRGTLVMSYRPMMQFAERRYGERDGSYFAGNGLRFATEQEARDQADDLLSRLYWFSWFGPTGYRVDLSADEPNYRWDSESHKIVAL